MGAPALISKLELGFPRSEGGCENRSTDDTLGRDTCALISCDEKWYRRKPCTVIRRSERDRVTISVLMAIYFAIRTCEEAATHKLSELVG